MQVIILRGIPGSGKSTYAAQLGGTVVSADHYMVDSQGVYSFDSAKLGHCHTQCFQAFQAALQAGEEMVVVDNTNTTWKEVKRYYEAALNAGAEVKILKFECTPKLGAERNTHGVPLETCQKMTERLRQKLPEGIVEWEHAPEQEVEDED